MKRKLSKTNQEKQQLALEVLSSESFLSVNKKLLSHFGPNLTIYIGNLVDKLKYFSSKGKLGEDGSFFLTYNDQMVQTGMSEYQLRKCKNKLKTMGVLSTQMRGIPPKEFYILDIERLVDEFLMNIPLVFKGISPKKLKELGFKNFRNNKETEYKETEFKDNITGENENGASSNEPSNGGKPSAKKRDMEFLSLANKLSKIIRTKKKMKHTTPQRKVWASDIRKLVEGNGIPKERIETALDWYEKNIGGQYIPVIESGSSLRNKFIKLENAMERDNGNGQSTKPPTPNVEVYNENIVFPEAESFQPKDGRRKA